MNQQLEIQNKQRAEDLHLEVLKIKDTILAGRKALIDVVVPIYREHLYKYLGFKSWSEYVNSTLNVPISSINNIVFPATYLLEAGYAIEDFEDINWARTTEIAKIVKQSGKLPEDEMGSLIEIAKKSKTRQDAKDFRDATAKVSKKHNLEEQEFLRVPCDKSFLDLFNLALDIQTKIQSKVTGKSQHSKQSLVEGILVNYFDNPDVRYILRSLSQEDLAPLFRLGGEGDELDGATL